MSLRRCTSAMRFPMPGATSHVARMYAAMSPGAKAITRRWSILAQSGVVGGISCRLNAALAIAMTDHVCGAFAGEVTGVEFLEGGVEVVEVERDCRCDPFVGVDLDDVQDIEAELLGLPTAARESSASEDDVIPTGRYGIRRLCSAEISCYPEVF